VTLAFALAASLLFGIGAYLLLNADLVRVVLGVTIISQSAVLTLIAAGVTRGRAPIYPLDPPISDPLSEAMALTAIVIGLAIVALLLVLVLRVVVAYGTEDLVDVAQEEAAQDVRLELEHARDHEDEEAAAR
jgi:multicomponent Na+:H+ antiporter subunit C